MCRLAFTITPRFIFGKRREALHQISRIAPSSSNAKVICNTHPNYIPEFRHGPWYTLKRLCILDKVPLLTADVSVVETYLMSRCSALVAICIGEKSILTIVLFRATAPVFTVVSTIKPFILRVLLAWNLTMTFKYVHGKPNVLRRAVSENSEIQKIVQPRSSVSKFLPRLTAEPECLSSQRSYRFASSKSDGWVY